MAEVAHKSSFLSVVCASVRMILNTIGESKATADCLYVEEAVKVNPLSAIQGPRRPTECLANAKPDNRLLKCSEMFASHGATLRPNDAA